MSARTLKSPGNLAFNRDSILNIKVEPNWKAIKLARERQNSMYNARENAWCKQLQNQVQDKCGIVKNTFKSKCKLNKPAEESFNILHVYSKATLNIDRSGHIEVFSIYRQKVFVEAINDG